MTLLAIVLVGCQSGRNSNTLPTPRALGVGETIGVVVATSTAPAARDGVRTLLSLTCTKHQLIVNTNLEGIVANADCSRQPLQAALERFLGQPVTITYTGDKLRITNPNAGVLDVAASDATIREINAPP